MNLVFLEIWRLRKRRGLFTFAGITVGAVAFGMWQHSIWAAIFAFAVECGIHFEAKRERCE